MKQKSATSLAVPKAAPNALTIPASITPKPTKRDLLEAMVERAQSKHEALKAIDASLAHLGIKTA